MPERRLSQTVSLSLAGQPWGMMLKRFKLSHKSLKIKTGFQLDKNGF
jgi:hypothetical protein